MEDLSEKIWTVARCVIEGEELISKEFFRAKGHHSQQDGQATADNRDQDRFARNPLSRFSEIGFDFDCLIDCQGDPLSPLFTLLPLTLWK